VDAALLDFYTGKEGVMGVKKLWNNVDTLTGIQLTTLMGVSQADKTKVVEDGLAAYLAADPDEFCTLGDRARQSCIEDFHRDIEYVFTGIDKVRPLMAKFGLAVLPNDEMPAQFKKLLAMLDETSKTRLREADNMNNLVKLAQVNMRDACA